MNLKLRIFITYMLLAQFFVQVAIAQEVNQPLKAEMIGGYSYSETFSKESLKKKSYKFRNYKVMGKSFKHLCDLLHKDGRRDLFIRILQENNKNRVNGCPACKPFYKVFAKACRKSSDSKKKKKKRKRKKDEVKEEEEKPQIKIYKQRDPNLEVVSYISYLFTELSKHEANSQQTYLAVKDFVKKLKVNQGKTMGEIDYIKSIHSYFLAPFDMHLQAEEEAERAKKEKDRYETTWTLAE